MGFGQVSCLAPCPSMSNPALRQRSKLKSKAAGFDATPFRRLAYRVIHRAQTSYFPFQTHKRPMTWGTGQTGQACFRVELAGAGKEAVGGAGAGGGSPVDGKLPSGTHDLQRP